MNLAFSSLMGILGTLLCSAALPAHAQVTMPEEYDKVIKSAEVVGALGSDLFGEQTSFYTGATTFTATDVSLPGNDKLPVAIGRRFVVESRDLSERNALLTRDGGFADWELEIPHLHGVFAKGKGWQVDSSTEAGKNLRCSLSQANMVEPPEQQGVLGGFIEGFKYWSGNSLYVPGGGDQPMLIVNTVVNPHYPRDGKQYTFVTNNQWYFSCLTATANGVAGDAFLAVSPDGTRYYFDWFATRSASTILFSGGSGGWGAGGTLAASSRVTAQAVGDPSSSSLQREEVWILPTKLVDRFNNTVTYTYDPANPWRLTKIAASDGRTLTITYSGSRIASVNDGTRTWSYTYANGLAEVLLPDGKKWTINFANLRDAYTSPTSNNATLPCSQQTASPTQSTYTGAITHPSGAVGEFSFRSQMHGRSYVVKTCPNPGSTGEGTYAFNPFYFETVGITSKKITGMGLAPMQWTYTFGPVNRSWLENCPNESCPSTKYVDVTAPGGEWTRYTFGNRFRSNEGKLLKVETGTGPTSILRTEATTYLLDPTGQAYPARVGTDPYDRSDDSSESYAPVVKRDITQQGTVFTWRVDAANGVYSLDAFARPTKIIRSSNATP